MPVKQTRREEMWTQTDGAKKLSSSLANAPIPQPLPDATTAGNEDVWTCGKRELVGLHGEKILAFDDRSELSFSKPCDVTFDKEHFTIPLTAFYWSRAKYLEDGDTASALLKMTELNEVLKKGQELTSRRDEDKDFGILKGIARALIRTNTEYRAAVLETGNAILCYANPFDSYIGAGIRLNHPQANDQSVWTGRNIMARMIMDVRAELMGEIGFMPPPHSDFPINEKDEELSSNAHNHYAIAYTTGGDLRSDVGVARAVAEACGKPQEVYGQMEALGGPKASMGKVLHHKTPRGLGVYHLVVKEKYWHKPDYSVISEAIHMLRAKCEADGIRDLGMSMFCVGLDCRDWGKVKQLIAYAFQGSHIALTAYRKQ